MVDVHTAFAVPELNDVAQNVYHCAVVFFLCIYLLFNDVQQTLLLVVEHKGVVYPAVYGVALIGTLDIVRNAQIICFLYKRKIALCGYHYNGNGVYPLVPVHKSKHLKAVHFGHYNIQQHQIYLILMSLDSCDGFLSVGSFYGVIIVFEYLSKHFTVHFGIVHDKYS